MRERARRRGSSVAVAVALSSLAVACGSQDEVLTSTTVSVPPTVAGPTSVPVPVTAPWKKGEAARAWKKFLSSYEVLDVSDYSRSECGLYTVMVTETSVTLHFWDGRAWTDVTNQLQGAQGNTPLAVHSADFTNDGVVDFFVTYDRDPDFENREYGAYLAIPWGGAYRCQWGWVDVDDGRDLTKRVLLPDVDKDGASVRGDGWEKGRWRARGVYEYLGSSSSFVFRRTSPDD